MSKTITEYWHPDKQIWVKKLPKKFIDRIVKTRTTKIEKP